MTRSNSILQLGLFAIILAFTASHTAKADTRAHVEYGYITPGSPGTANVHVDLIVDRFQEGGGTSFWLRVRQTSKRFDASTNSDRIDEIVSIRDFPARHYRKLIGNLRNVRNWDAIVTTDALCDSRFRHITVNRKHQSIADSCSPTIQNGAARTSVLMNPIEAQMLAAVRTIDQLVNATISNPDATYQRDRANQGAETFNNMTPVMVD